MELDNLVIKLSRLLNILDNFKKQKDSLLVAVPKELQEKVIANINRRIKDLEPPLDNFKCHLTTKLTESYNEILRIINLNECNNATIEKNLLDFDENK